MRLSKVHLSSLWARFNPWLLAVSWLFGMVFGVLTARGMEAVLIPMLQSSVVCNASFVGLLTATLLPFLLSAFAVSMSEPWLLLIISMFKAFSFSFCSCGVSLAFGQSSWLVRFLFLFSDLCLVPLLYLYWLRHISGNRRVIRWELPMFLCAATVVGCIDYCFIAPFLVSVMEK